MAAKDRDPRVSVRIALIIRTGDRILLARHEKEGRSYWVFPGGRLEYGETLEECGRRELLEEAGIDVRIGHLLYLTDRTAEGTQDVNLFFRGYLEEGRPELGNDPEDHGGRVLKQLALVSHQELGELDIFPPEAKAAVLEDWENGFTNAGKYLKDN
jgi:8-oxo-dGTP diphosphatase